MPNLDELLDASETIVKAMKYYKNENAALKLEVERLVYERADLYRHLEKMKEIHDALIMRVYGLRDWLERTKNIANIPYHPSVYFGMCIKKINEIFGEE
jgi:hypothetical protein